MDNNRVITVGNWIVVFILMAIPLVNLIMLFVWAFGSGAPESQANFAKAYLLFLAIFVVLWFVFIGAMIGAMA
tara:strand:+ start:241 stop:459 length:219 start_codon:yes stop_codon:yes gene_type:complete